MDSPTFRSTFPEFASTSVYPDAQVNFWLGLGITMLKPDAWGPSIDQGLALFIAHHLVVGQRDQAAVAAGGVPGDAKGIVTSKSVDKVSVSYDAASIQYEGAGFWNMSSYGIRFYRLARMMGAGGVQL